jgi:hypothetical protein
MSPRLHPGSLIRLIPPSDLPSSEFDLKKKKRPISQQNRKQTKKIHIKKFKNHERQKFLLCDKKTKKTKNIAREIAKMIRQFGLRTEMP